MACPSAVLPGRSGKLGAISQENTVRIQKLNEELRKLKDASPAGIPVRGQPGTANNRGTGV